MFDFSIIVSELVTYILNSFQYFSIFNHLLILLISFFSNLFSAISGGGAGLIQLPALIHLGIPYYQAMALHKAATVALGVGSTTRNLKNIKNDSLVIIEILLFGIPGVLLGTSIVNYLSEEILYTLLGLFSLCLGIYSICKPDLGLKTKTKNFNFKTNIRFTIFVFFIGVLNGAISSGTGLFMTILLIKTFGIDFLRSISITFLTVGIFWNAVGAISLSRLGTVPIDLLIILIIGSFLGGLIGAHLTYLKGNRLIKNSYTIICFLISFSLFIKVFIGLKS